MNAGLEARLDEIPDTPGVYLMKDDRGRVLYIGKAKNLRSRVRSYFLPSAPHPPKNRALVSKVVDVDWIDTTHEVDALLLESRLIKGIQPRYNIELRDGKSFPYLCISRDDDFPIVFIARETEFERSRCSSYGPFTDVTGLRRSVKLLQRVFKFRTCTLTIQEDDPRRRTFRPCLLHSIDRCLAPCGVYTDKKAYRKQIRSLERFLRGDRNDLLSSLQDEMQTASNDLQYEKAATLRDQIESLRSLDQMACYGDFIPGDLLHLEPMVGIEELADRLDLAELPRHIAGVDIANLKRDDPVGAIVSFIDGVPFKAGYRHFKIQDSIGPDDYAMMREVLRRHFRRVLSGDEPAPDLLLLDGGHAHLRTVCEEFRRIEIDPPPLAALAKKCEEIFLVDRDEPLRLSAHSKGLQLLQHVRDEAHRFARRYHHLRRRKRTTGR